MFSQAGTGRVGLARWDNLLVQYVRLCTSLNTVRLLSNCYSYDFSPILTKFRSHDLRASMEKKLEQIFITFYF